MFKKLNIFKLLLALIFMAAPALAVDQRVQYTEELVGANHPTKSDTLNRALLVGHNNDGTHKVRYALVKKTADQSITASTNTILTWDSEVNDTDNIHDNATNNNRLTVPTGVTRVRLSANVGWDNNTSGDRQVVFLKNGAYFYGTPYATNKGISLDSGMNMASAPLQVTGGDYFEVRVYQTSGGAVNVNANATVGGTWFAMEILD